MTADTVFNESSILMTHLASQKPPVNSGTLNSPVASLKQLYGGYLMIENVMWLLNMNAILPSNQQHRNREITIKTELCCHTDRD